MALAAAVAFVAAPAAGMHTAGPGGSGAADVETVTAIDAVDASPFARDLLRVTLTDDGADLLGDADVNRDFVLRHADELARGEAAASDWNIAGTVDGLVVIEEVRVRHVTVDALAPAIAAEAQVRTGEPVSAERVRAVDFAARAGNDALVDVVTAAAGHGAGLDPVVSDLTRADLAVAAAAQEPLTVSRDVAGFVGEDGILLVERAWFVLDVHAFRATVNDAAAVAHEAGASAEERVLETVVEANERVHEALDQD